MQSLDVISVNIWQILISLINLLIMFLIIKKFLFKPVNNMLAKRQAELDSKYEAANSAMSNAEKNENLWNEKIKTAKDEADAIISSAADTAKWREEKIISDAKDKADSIIKRAEAEAELELKKAEAEIKNEIVGVSSALTEKLLSREINMNDHKNIVDSFIEKIGDDNE
ncbi:MAG: F0F1 ATP synthase subunit B [Clostridia bacterium]|nr:F0F1 ATP synthase subunit B [Clostridia bacterium]